MEPGRLRSMKVGLDAVDDTKYDLRFAEFRSQNSIRVFVLTEIVAVPATEDDRVTVAVSAVVGKTVLERISTADRILTLIINVFILLQLFGWLDAMASVQLASAGEDQPFRNVAENKSTCFHVVVLIQTFDHATQPLSFAVEFTFVESGANSVDDFGQCFVGQ